MSTQENLTTTAPWVIHERLNFKPLGTNVLVVVEDTERKTPGGLLLPTRDREAALIANIVAVGVACRPGELKAGDRVMFEKYAGTIIRSTDKPAVLILDQDDIMCTLTPGKKGCFCGGAKRGTKRCR